MKSDLYAIDIEFISSIKCVERKCKCGFFNMGMYYICPECGANLKRFEWNEPFYKEN